MPQSSPAMPVDVLRDALRERVAESSLRVAGEEVGMSWKWVDKFLAGAQPQPATRRKLTEWYIRRVASRDEEPASETAQAALAILVRHLPPAERAEVVDKFIELLSTVIESKGYRSPEWMAHYIAGLHHP
jgi:hypothetical protein